MKRTIDFYFNTSVAGPSKIPKDGDGPSTSTLPTELKTAETIEEKPSQHSINTTDTEIRHYNKQWEHKYSWLV